MYVSHNELLWMLRQVDGQRVNQEKLVRKIKNRGISSLLPYFDDIETLFNKSKNKDEIKKNALRDLEIRTNQHINYDESLNEISFRDFENYLLPVIVRSLAREDFSTLEKGARVSVRLDSGASCVKPGSEGFISEKSPGLSRVRFYPSAGHYGVPTPTMEIPDQELQLLTLGELLERHQDLRCLAQYFYNDCMLRSMKSGIDSSVYSFAANLAVKLLVDQGFITIEGDDFVSVPERIFSILAPKLDATYKNPTLFSSPSLSAPPSERKPHVLRLELTTGCDYNKCTFCTEYSAVDPVTKTFAAFRAHTCQVADAIGSEKSRIERLFIGSGNTLGVDTDLLLESLDFATGIFNPQRISMYGRTASILEKSVDELKWLKDAGLSMLYWGLESGSDRVLTYIGKDCTRHEMIEASQMLVEAGIEVSAMLMPGAGGLRLSEEHVLGTLELLHNINIRYLTLLAINPGEDSLYAKNMMAERNNRHLTPGEVNAQVYRLLKGLTPTGVQIGMFTEEVDQVSSNTRRFNYQFTGSNKELLLRDFWT